MSVDAPLISNRVYKSPLTIFAAPSTIILEPVALAFVQVISLLAIASVPLPLLSAHTSPSEAVPQPLWFALIAVSCAMVIVIGYSPIHVQVGAPPAYVNF